MENLNLIYISVITKVIISRSNLATNHAEIVEHIITLEEQVAEFSEMLQIIDKNG